MTEDHRGKGSSTSCSVVRECKEGDLPGEEMAASRLTETWCALDYLGCAHALALAVDAYMSISACVDGREQRISGR